MKLSELTFSMALKQGADHFCMHYDASDSQRQVNNQAQLDAVKRQLMEKYGDVDITVDPDAPWFDVVTINDERWQADYKAYCDKKQAWCDKYGCD